MTIKRLKEQVEVYLQNRPRNAYKTKELARSLQIAKQGEEYQLLKQALRELQNENRIERIDGRKWSIHREEQEVVGTIEVAGNGHGFVLTHEEPPRTIFIHKRNLKEAQGGDIVNVTVYAYSSGKNDEGEVKEVLGRPRKQITGKLKQIKGFTFLEPDDKKISTDIVLQGAALHGAEEGDKVVIEILAESSSKGGRGLPEVVEVLGREGDARAEMMAVARRFGLSEAFPDAAEKEASEIPSTIPKKEIAKRLDLRKLECFTIDPVDAKDFDDAVSLQILDDGNYELGVHIADVGYYVRPGSAIDKEAKTRATSVYLVNHVIPMLPERLSNHMCSLKEGVDRLAYSAIMQLTPRGKLLHAEFHKSVIKSNKRFTYQEVQEIVDSGKGPHLDTLKTMDAFARTLTKKRIREGGIDFDSQEADFFFDEGGNVVDMKPKTRLQSMRMIEEFMLMANRAVAESISKMGKALPFMYRVHDLPDAEKVKELMDFISHLGIRVELNPRSSKSFQALLEHVAGSPEEPVVNDVTIRSMAKAVYSEKNIGHFGLGFSHYTHFTSPIRRYPDLIVHRLLLDYVEGKAPAYADRERKELKELALHCSARERLAVDAERESVKVKQIEFMEKHVGDEFDAIIDGVTNYGIYVETIQHLAQGLVHVRDMGDDYYEFNSKKKALIGLRRKKIYRMGDHVRVRVARVDRVDRHIDFMLLDDARETADAKKLAQKASGNDGKRKASQKASGSDGRHTPSQSSKNSRKTGRRSQSKSSRTSRRKR